ncbi:hypothetical protein [Micromonospora rubida]|uniref:hypothetical protein n=1 Tax=Micromonospora rubida TaxID=2697657 RepID=UPI00137734DB|nr:hypothetical protein [Micromonospora rubida]NBE82155.1 hypothetical protein [Micromonospora rubida]
MSAAFAALVPAAGGWAVAVGSGEAGCAGSAVLLRAGVAFFAAAVPVVPPVAFFAATALLVGVALVATAFLVGVALGTSSAGAVPTAPGGRVAFRAVAFRAAWVASAAPVCDWSPSPAVAPAG